MGVPYLFAALRKQYTECVSIECDSKCDSLFLDWNGVIHVACRSVVDECNTRQLRLDTKDLECRMLDRIVQELRRIIGVAQPTRLLFVSIDGVAPIGKISHQRKRRYKSIKDKQEMQLLNEKFNMPAPCCTWDSNAITPGTVFMSKVGDAIRQELQSVYSRHTSLKIIFSDAMEQGEGEQKIIRYMRKQNDLGTCWIHGLDADFIFLSLLTHNQRIFMWRDDPDKACFLNIDKLRKNICNELGQENYSSFSIINDFVALCVLLGNDFLPGLFCLPIFPNGFQILVSTYKKVLDNSKTHLIIDGKLQMQFLINVFRSLAMIEALNITKRGISWITYRPVQSGTDYDVAFFNYERNLPRPARDRINPRGPRWQERYYKCMSFQRHDIASIVKDYLTGMQWVVDYYIGDDDKIAWGWHYIHDVAPLVEDLIRFGSEYTFQPFVQHRPVKPIVQLLLVLPPQSDHLISNKYKSILKHLKRPMHVSENIMYKDKRHEGVPRLPIMNVGYIIKLVQQIR